jgi:hypothetical protein
MRIYMPICGEFEEKVRIMRGFRVKYGGDEAVFMECIGELSHTALFI